jgi:hypothetical protein
LIFIKPPFIYQICLINPLFLNQHPDLFVNFIFKIKDKENVDKELRKITDKNEIKEKIFDMIKDSPYKNNDVSLDMRNKILEILDKNFNNDLEI